MRKKANGDALDFGKLLRAKLAVRGIVSLEEASAREWYQATVLSLREILEERYRAFRASTVAEGKKQVAYLCMEFLIGRSLVSYLDALSLREELSEELSRFGYTVEDIAANERDPGLGNGGLGRLAACFLDSLSAQGYSAIGYSLCYEAGLFRQKLVDGAQVELPDDWIPEGGAFLVPRPEESVTVRFGGIIEESWENGGLHIVHKEYDLVRAVPYDIFVAGNGGNTVNVLRLFRARDVAPKPDGSESQAGYVKALLSHSAAEALTKNLYPPDETEEGKLLRLCQQYFLVSASVQNIIAGHFAEGEGLESLPLRVAVHINDTHPALAIPEWMRILMDVYSYSWEDAFRMVRAMVTYTNHTVLPEALETWRLDLFRVRLPRIYSIVEEMNRRFTAELWEAHKGDWDRISRMAIIAYGQVRMANLSVVGSSVVNGVSKLHTAILKRTVFADFYQEYPERFTGVTNGISHRRWLLMSNRRLCGLLDEVIGKEYRKEPEALAALYERRGDTALLDRLLTIKRKNKEDFSDFLKARGIRPLDTSAVFDVQIKRMHEYKRQLLNLLKILSLWQEMREEPHSERRPILFLFGAKAAPGYYMAKELIRLIVATGRELAKDPCVRDVLRLEFCEEYNVTMAESLIPAADFSEQISLAGKEASGTGCMKLMMNGALTVGTHDGANVEICEAVGEENIYMFGLKDNEVEALWRQGYDARSYYRASTRLRAAVDRLYYPMDGQDFSHIADYLIAGASAISDPYMCLADFESYRTVYDTALVEYEKKHVFAEKSLINIARSGRFSADRSIREYAERIWHLGRGS